MSRDAVLAILEADESRLRSEFGVQSLALFGSVARDEARFGNDVDLLVEYEPGRQISLFDHIGTALHLEAVLGVPKVDLIIRHCVIDELKERIYGEAMDAFGPEAVEVPAQAQVGGGARRPGWHVLPPPLAPGRVRPQGRPRR